MMLDLKQIESFYPKHLKPHKRNILREYLQFKVLEAIYDSPFAASLCFMGGSAIHVLHGSPRFSEDLDFDNLSLEKSGFEDLITLIKRKLELQGYSIEARTTLKTAFRAALRFPHILYENRISSHKNEKLILRIDTEAQDFAYKPVKTLINKFDVFTRIQAVPLDLLLAQKLLCILKRPRILGRDFYDVIYLAGKTKPNLKYLMEKLQLKSPPQIKERLLKRCKETNLKRLSEDVRPFLYNPEDAKKVLLFLELLENMRF